MIALYLLCGALWLGLLAVTSDHADDWQWRALAIAPFIAAALGVLNGMRMFDDLIKHWEDAGADMSKVRKQ